MRSTQKKSKKKTKKGKSGVLKWTSCPVCGFKLKPAKLKSHMLKVHKMHWIPTHTGSKAPVYQKKKGPTGRKYIDPYVAFRMEKNMDRYTYNENRKCQSHSLSTETRDPRDQIGEIRGA